MQNRASARLLRPHERRARWRLAPVLIASPLLCAAACSRPAPQASERAPAPSAECATADDCIQEGACFISRPSCAARATYAQIHCGREQEEALRGVKMPAFTCACTAGRCTVDHVNRAGP